MATARAIFQAHVDGLLAESIPIDLQWTLSLGVLQLLTNTTLSSGDNTLTPPTGTKIIAIVPPPTNAAVLKTKGASGDSGWSLQSALPTVMTWTTGTAIVNAASSVTGVTLIYLG